MVRILLSRGLLICQSKTVGRTRSICLPFISGEVTGDALECGTCTERGTGGDCAE